MNELLQVWKKQNWTEQWKYKSAKRQTKLGTHDFTDNGVTSLYINKKCTETFPKLTVKKPTKLSTNLKKGHKEKYQWLFNIYSYASGYKTSTVKVVEQAWSL